MTKRNAKTSIVVNNDTTLTPRMTDYTNVIFNNSWKAIRPAGRNYINRMLWEFECLFCGEKIIRTAANINGCTCVCQSKHRDCFTLSFYDWCKQNNHNDWIELWDYTLNKIDIHNVGYSSDEKYWFKCNNHNNRHHSEEYRLSNLTQGSQKGIMCNQCNSLAQYGIDIFGDKFLDIYWDYDKNDVNPWEISKCSGKKVWIKCPCCKHDSHIISVNNAKKYKYSCPECVNELTVSKLHNKVIDFLESLSLEILCEFNCNIIAINPRTGHYLPYDIEIVGLNIMIEVHGEHHYLERSIFTKTMAERMNISTKEAFEYRKWIDDYKKQFAIDSGYNFIEIPYWSENKEEYKEIILNTLNKVIC